MARPMRKFLPAVIILLIAAAMVGTSTYAWFSMNNKVNVTGMTVTATVDQNLLIAPDTINSTSRKDDADFGNTLVQPVSGTLKPVSSTDGKRFFYTDGFNVKGNGDAMNETYISYDRDNLLSATAFNANYNSVGAVGYVDYVFQLKAVNYTTDAEIRLTKLNLTYGGDSLIVTVGHRDIDTKAYRVAVFYEDVTGGTSVGTLNHANVHTLALFKPNGATNFDGDRAVSGITSLSTVAYCSKNTTAKIDIAGGETRYYKFVIRLWLEGEDITCRSDAYARLNDKWALDVEFNQLAIAEPANSVVYLNQTTTAAAEKPSISTEATILTEGRVRINGVNYYPVADKTLRGDQLYVDSTTPIRPDSKFYIIPDENKLYVTDVTIQVKVVPPTVASAVINGAVNVTVAAGKLSNDKVPARYTWMNVDGRTVVENGASEFRPEETGEYYCLIGDENDYVYKTASYAFINAVCAEQTGNISAIMYEATSYSWKRAEDGTQVGTSRTLVAPGAGTYYCEMVKGGATYRTASVTIVETVVDGAKGTVKLTSGKLYNGKTPANYEWKKANGTAAGSDEAEFTAATAGSYYCLITTEDGKVYRTANVDLAP